MPPPHEYEPPQHPGEQILDLVSGEGEHKIHPLHKIYRRRRKAGPRDISRCSHPITVEDPIDGTGNQCRTDSMEYQTWELASAVYAGDANARANIKPFFEQMCPLLKERFVIYGMYGKGTYGVIFAARERHPEPNTRPRHYVMKMEAHRPISQCDGPSRIGVYAELDSTELRYIQMEANIMQLLSRSERFPRLDSVYLHENFQVIVMAADTACYCAEVIDNMPEVQGPEVVSIPPCLEPGNRLIQNKVTKLNEIQVCKVTSQLLEGMMYLMDLNISHDDLSHRNYLVDNYLNAQLIDFGLSAVAPESPLFKTTELSILHAFEYQHSPEILYELLKPYYANLERDPQVDQIDLYMPHDVRTVHLWKFAVLVYDLLHGYSPWELPGREFGDIKADNMHGMGRYQVLLDERRMRIMNEELPIDERLSQDCVDVLRAMLATEVADRPTIRELVTFPWFQGHWADHDLNEFKRPDLGPR
ncbi:hypothetical protein FQN55_004014 [Onygenales sp. PD_40]|nr:hypothetical protein FQN55_004014 [Onygenales sp. PD_40]